MWRVITNTFAEKTGKILLLAPSGTTDTFDKNS
jgi:hypothetical protein